MIIPSEDNRNALAMWEGNSAPQRPTSTYGFWCVLTRSGGQSDDEDEPELPPPESLIFFVAVALYGDDDELSDDDDPPPSDEPEPLELAARLQW